MQLDRLEGPARRGGRMRDLSLREFRLLEAHLSSLRRKLEEGSPESMAGRMTGRPSAR